MLPPPVPSNSLKRKIPPDRTGEAARTTAAPSSSRPVNGVAKATSTVGTSRQASFSSSVSSSHQNSIASARHASFSGSLGPGARLPSAQSHRPQSATSNSRIQKPMHSSSRPSTVQEPHPLISNIAQGVVKKKGMIPFSLYPMECRKMPGRRGISESYETQMNISSTWASRPGPTKYMHQVSLSTAMSSLSLHGKPWSTPMVDSETPCTPSQIPKRAPSVTVPWETPSPTKSPRKTPTNLAYLTRDSNTRVAPKWDTDNRLTLMEQQYSQVKEIIDSATMESNSLKELNEVYKGKGI